jgi:hypothetical protein
MMCMCGCVCVCVCVFVCVWGGILFICLFKCSDGASAVLLVSGKVAKALRLPVLARVRGFADAELVRSIN